MAFGLGIFAAVVSGLAATGFYGFLLPFVLTFTLVYAIMLKTGISADAKIAGVIALAVAFMMPLISVFNAGVGELFVLLFGSGAIIMAMVLVVILILTMLGIKIFI